MTYIWCSTCPVVHFILSAVLREPRSQGEVGPRYCLAFGTSVFRANITSFHILYYLIAVLDCFFVLFHFCCSDAQVFGTILVHEFDISYCHTEWYLIFLRNEMVIA